MEQYEKEEKNSRRPLEHVEPIPPVTIARDVWFRLGRDQNAVNRMKQQRQEDAEDLDQQQERYIVDVLNGLYKARLTVQRFRVGEHVDKKEQSERNDARQLMQLAQQECPGELYRHLMLAMTRGYLRILRPNPAFGNAYPELFMIRPDSYKIK